VHLLARLLVRKQGAAVMTGPYLCHAAADGPSGLLICLLEEHDGPVHHDYRHRVMWTVDEAAGGAVTTWPEGEERP
jgi:hypothetical protein